MAQLKDLIVAGATRLIGAAYGSSLQLSGTLILANTTDLSGTSYTGPALVVGGPYTTNHMEIDANEIQAKTNSATTADLYLNKDGGTVYATGQAVVLNNDTRLSNARTPTAHATTATTYGVGTTANYGHVKLVSGELADTTEYNDGVAAAAAHTHAQYLTAIQHRYINVNNTPILTTAGTALTLSAGTGISLSGDSNSNGVVTINCTVTGGGGGGGDGNSYHTTGSWSDLTYTATAVGGAGTLAFTIPTGTTSTTVALGNHTHDEYTSIPFIIGSGSTAGTSSKAAAWKGTYEPITAYTDGLLILYKSDVAGHSNGVTLNINNLGAKTIYLRNDTKLTTHFAVHSNILLVYNTSLNSGCWVCIDTIQANSNTWRNIRLNGSTTNFLGTATSTGALTISAGTGISVTGASGKITIANTAPNTNDVTYTSKTDSVNYPVVFGNAATPTSPGGISYNSNFYYNPSDKRLSFTKLRFLHATDNTAYIDIGLPTSYASASSIHFPWFNKDTDASNAMYLVGKIAGDINGPLEISSAGRIKQLSCSKKGTILWYDGSSWVKLDPPTISTGTVALKMNASSQVYWA